MKKMNHGLVFLLFLICVLSFLISGCWRRVWKITIPLPLPNFHLLIIQIEGWEKIGPEPDELCRLLRGIQIPKQWNIVAADTFKIEDQLIDINPDTSAAAYLDSNFHRSGYKWVVYKTVEPLNLDYDADSVKTRFVYEIDMNLPIGPEEAVVYEKSGEDCEHRWGADAEFVAKIPREPTHTEWGLILFILAIAGSLGYLIIRRRKTVISSR